MTSDDRRKFLRLAASTAAAAGVNMTPLGVRQALAIPAHHQTGTLHDVKHIVVLMQENRSFDHYFGTLKGVRGFDDPRAATLPGGKPVWAQPNNGSAVLPFHPSEPQLGMQFLAGTPHDWNSTHRAWNEGRYDQWVPNKGVNAMSHFVRQDIPYHFALADAFTVCDAYHCSLMGPTDPNRYHLWTGWVGNDGSGGGPVISNAEVGYGWSTFPERLQASGISWKIYQDVGTGLDANGYWGWTDNPYIGNYGDNSLLYFHQYQNAAPGSALYERARTGTNVAANPNQSFFEILQQDVRNNTLPAVSWIVAPEAFSEHANWPANYGAWYTSQVLEVLTSNPEVWSKTALFVTFDENDGFFDHVIPPFPPTSRDRGLSTVDVSGEIFQGDGSNQSGPYGLGQRVPMTIVSPWTKGGWVCSQVFDHTSLIRFIEARFGADHPGIIEPNITPWRRAVCGDLTSAFNFANPQAGMRPLPATSAYAATDALRHPSVLPLPPAVQAMPRQEPGLKRSRAIPYELHVNGQLDNARRQFTMEFANSGQAGAVFLVGTPGSANAPQTYTVEAGKSLSDSWTTMLPADGHYNLRVSGPNGFMRHFSGDAVAAAGKVSIAPELHATSDAQDGGRLRLVLSNRGSRALKLTVTPNAYTRQAARSFTLAPGASIQDHWQLQDSQGWYDLSVTTDASTSFLRRLAGRVETGQASVTDPLIGATHD